MPRYNVDFSQVEDYEVLPAGDYPVVILSATLRKSKDSEFPYLNWDLQVTEGECEGRHAFMTTSLSPKSLWRMKSVFKNLGLLPDSGQLDLDIDDESDQLIDPQVSGVPAVAVIKKTMYQGRESNSVEDLLAIEHDDFPKKAETRPAISISGPSQSTAKPKVNFK